MRYKVGDVVKLRDDLEVGKCYGKRAIVSEMANLAGMIATIKSVGHDYYELEEDIDLFDWTDEMIEGLWGECKSTEQVKKDNEHITDAWRYALESMLESKLKLIDVLNKIANGELKEGSKLIWGYNTYTYDSKYPYWESDVERKIKLWRKAEEHCEYVESIPLYHLNDEVELIEPNDFADVGKMVEPTDNTTEKIEELDYDDFWEWDPWGDGYEQEEFVGTETAIKMIFKKLNEVIRKINKEG